IHPTKDYWHKIEELWKADERAANERESAKNGANPTACGGTKYLYRHNQLVAEIPLQTDGNTALQAESDWENAIYWLYQNDDFTPTARYQNGRLHYTVADQIGTITELMSEEGYIHYRQKLNLWGDAKSETLHYNTGSDEEIECNLRFVGQYYDEESGLHYNRFRYYSPETGQYISSDPIGLLGGFNPYGYVFDPTGWVDPLGLTEEYVYRLVDANGNTVYYGISNDPSRRVGEHVKGDPSRGIVPKDFDHMEVLTGPLTHDQARTLEGGLIRSKIDPLDVDKPVMTQLKNAGLLNENRGRVRENWVSQNPLNDLNHLFLDESENINKPNSKNSNSSSKCG
ncbi:RHS repeat-associated core domain-containing protein, partial [Pasteurellaceae bacterium LIM206]|nr:RHS repeat-associated core domain-containing protein [Pasteurellaceae bacterium LIM206]